MECNTEASAVAAEIHNFLGSAGRRMAPASTVRAEACVGCDVCMTMCPFGAITLVERPADAPRPAEVKDDGKLAVIDAEACRACGICAANCPEMAIDHNLTDDALYGRLRLMAGDVERPVIGFYCKECAGAAISLSGLRHDTYPANVRLIELPCLGRVSALHIVEAARLGAAGVILAGCAEGPLPVPRRRHQRRRRRPRLPASCWPTPVSRCRSSSGTSAPSTATASAGASACSAPAPRATRRRRPCWRRRPTASTGRRARPPWPERRPPGRRSSTRRSPARPARQEAVVAVSELVTREVAALAAENRICYQCGQCTAACPSGGDLDSGPRRLMRLILTEQADQLLESEDLWRCSGCGSCSAACPMELDVAAALARLRALSRAHGGPRCPEREAATVATRRLSSTTRSTRWPSARPWPPAATCPTTWSAPPERPRG